MTPVCLVELLLLLLLLLMMMMNLGGSKERIWFDTALYVSQHIVK